MQDKSTPAITVILPMYGVERYIERAIKSVQDQSFKDVEILCVDDASPDASAQIVERMAKEDPRIRLIKKPKNEGLYMARFTGYEHARGEYVTNLDSDDTLAPEALQKLYEVARQTDADVTLGELNYLKKDGSVVIIKRKSELMSTPDGYLKAIQNWTSCSVCAALYKLSFIKGCHLISCPGLNNAEDRYALTQMLTSSNPPKKIAFLPYPVYNYHTNPVSLSKRKLTREKVDNTFIATLKSYDLIHERKPDMTESAQRFLLLQAGFYMEQGARRDWMSTMHPVMDSILTRKRMVELVGQRLGHHYYFCMQLPLYRKAAWGARQVIRKLQHKI
ncbi:MAG: glycosyltransferase [Muribaculaceae bacterium]|nr:glycosyltransferase [Muribaculaceae bacterium]